MVLLQGPTGWRFLVSEVALQTANPQPLGIPRATSSRHISHMNNSGHVRHMKQSLDPQTARWRELHHQMARARHTNN